jgi:hypothetical protein
MAAFPPRKADILRSAAHAAKVSTTLCLGKQVKHNGGRYSVGLYAGPPLTPTGVTIPNSANSLILRLQTRLVPAYRDDLVI